MGAENFFRLSYGQFSELFLTLLSMCHTCSSDYMTTKHPSCLSWAMWARPTGWKVPAFGSFISWLLALDPQKYTLYPSLTVLASSKSVVFKLGVISPPKGSWQFWKYFWSSQLWERRATRTMWVETQDATTCPSMQRTASIMKNNLV